MADFIDDISINTIIGPGTFVNGGLRVTGFLRVVVLSTGLILGSVLTKKIRLDDDVFLHGYCFAVDNQAEFEKAEKEYKNRQGLAASALVHSR